MSIFDLFKRKENEKIDEVVNVADETAEEIKPVKEKKEKDEAIVWVSLPTRNKLKLLKKEMNVKNLDVVIQELIKLYEQAKGDKSE